MTVKKFMANKRDPDKEEPDKTKPKIKPILEEKPKEDNVEDVDYDDLLSSAGEFGKYQIILFFSTFPFYFFGVFVYYSQLFMTEISPNHWCWIPELENLTDIDRRDLAIPADINTRFGYSHCEAYDVNWTEILSYGLTPDESWKTVPCQHGWEFNKSEIPYPTISSELNWVCDKDSHQATAQAIFFIGSAIGGVIIGWISDRFGRLPALIVANMVGALGGFSSTFATSFPVFTAFRFIMGMAYDNCMLMAYLIVLEYVAPKYRSLMSNMSFALFYATAATALPWIALLCGHWKIISLATSLPLLLAIFTPLFLPESPRWLLARGKVEDAIKRILVIGRVNKKEIPPNLIDKFRLSCKKSKPKKVDSCFEILKRPLLRNMFICICVEYMCCTIVFDGLVRSVSQLDFNYFLSFSLVSFTEFPSMLLTAFIMDWTGRRWLTAITMIITCIFSMITVSLHGISSLAAVIIARFTVSIAYSAAMQWAAEMLPVTVRGSGASIIHICGYIATAISPYVIYLENYVYWLPLVVYGGIAGVGAVIAFGLPETAKKDMPNTFEEAEDLVRQQKFWDFPCVSKNDETATPVKESLHI